MRVLQFMRFQKTADGTYFGIMEPLYNVLSLTVRHFRDRFADQPGSSTMPAGASATITTAPMSARSPSAIP